MSDENDRQRRVELSGHPAMLDMQRQRKLAKAETMVWEALENLSIEDREDLLLDVLAVVQPAAMASRASRGVAEPSRVESP